jgi:hypothetical protein
MKNTLLLPLLFLKRKCFTIVVFIFLTIVSFSLKVAAQDIAVSYKEFYTALSPFGQWIDDSEYGYAWIPNVDEDFQPYWTNGYWVMTDHGNTWVSDYPWGWACFHYGRWTFNRYYGWIWIPGSEWSPGWVAWRWGSGYCGWAPLSPGFNWSTGGNFSCPDDWWILMHPRHLLKTQYATLWRGFFMRNPGQTRQIIEQTPVVTNKYILSNNEYFSGPRAADIQKATQIPVKTYRLVNAATRGTDRVDKNIVRIYHPEKFPLLPSDAYRPRPLRTMPAPVRIRKPEAIGPRLTQQREFKRNMEVQHSAWSHPVPQQVPQYNRNTPVQ